MAVSLPLSAPLLGDDGLIAEPDEGTSQREADQKPRQPRRERPATRARDNASNHDPSMENSWRRRDDEPEPMRWQYRQFRVECCGPLWELKERGWWRRWRASQRTQSHDPASSQADDAPCNGDDKWLNGVCYPKPTCGAAGAGRGFVEDCCSRNCVQAVGFCATGLYGHPCYGASDCADNLPCVGYVCGHRTCQAGQNYCADGRSHQIHRFQRAAEIEV